MLVISVDSIHVFLLGIYEWVQSSLPSASMDCSILFRGQTYNITRIDTFEGYKEDLTLYCNRRARQ